MTEVRAPFPWFGGKSRVADLVWERFGPIPNYVEPFAGSMAVLLARPHEPGVETVNDLDCYLANFWRAVQAEPETVARWADGPVNEADIHARHLWLVCQEGFRQRMMTDPDYYDAKIAGWWVWGISCWIGSGWCVLPNWSGRISAINSGRGIHAATVESRGVAKKRPRIARGGRGVTRQVPDISGNNGAAGRGIHASGLEEKAIAVLDWMEALRDRLRKVRVCCGDWKRVLGKSPTECIGVTAVFLDPPYGKDAKRQKDIYREDSLDVSMAVREWALEYGENPLYRIALCGYEGEHTMPPEWKMVAWKANGGHGNAGNGRGRENAERERIWFSPHCLETNQAELFEK